AHTLPEPVKSRTVAIRVQHATFKFTATPKEQRILDEAGAEGVRSLINQMLLNQRNSYQNVLQHEQHQHQLKQNQNKTPRKPVPLPKKR
ncbi:MAG TPA: hypothetical protein VFP93_00210, partial [Gammaproteobacteria bacterium]|nr:hypothetical protein [Gammaproteobacteria bacterium]